MRVVISLSRLLVCRGKLHVTHFFSTCNLMPKGNQEKANVLVFLCSIMHPEICSTIVTGPTSTSVHVKVFELGFPIIREEVKCYSFCAVVSITTVDAV